jgi:LmbE family N-acetylglucosaminyl deacetylase
MPLATGGATKAAVAITSLQVKAVLKRGGNETGERVPDDEMRCLRSVYSHMQPHAVCPTWNYTLHPRHGQEKNNQGIS